MENYFLVTKLLNLDDQNLPPFKEARLNRIASIQKINALYNVARRTQPKLPRELTGLDKQDPEWDDDMTYPTIENQKYLSKAMVLGLGLGAYGYNWHRFTLNPRFRTIRYLFPVVWVGVFGDVYSRYNVQVKRAAAFDLYTQLRAHELVNQNSFLLGHDDVKRYVWWCEDFKETMQRVHRQANNHSACDFKDSELIMQDFVNRYADPSKEYPTNAHEHELMLN